MQCFNLYTLCILSVTLKISRDNLEQNGAEQQPGDTATDTQIRLMVARMYEDNQNEQEQREITWKVIIANI